MAGTMAELGLPQFLRLSIQAEPDPALVLTLEPDAGAAALLTEEAVQAIIRENGAETWLINHEQIRLLISLKGSLKAPQSFRIAERRDAEIKLHISDNYCEARITIIPAFGGRPITEEQIMIAMLNAGVIHGVKEQIIPDLVRQGRCEAVLIAESTPPEPGQDARFERLVRESDRKGLPDTSKTGRIDYHDLDLFLTVAQGTPLLRKIPPNPGKPGIAIDGSPIPAPVGRNETLLPGNGTEVSKTDPNLLVASTSGMPIFTEEYSAKVVPRLDLEGIDYSTGNIKFDGSVFIQGPIQAGFKIAAGGNIVAMDTVDASDFTAGGSIQFECGVFGRNRCQINAKGNIKARFLNECTIYCGGNLEVTDLISNCTIVCEGNVIVGQGLGKGQINGGKVLAAKGIQANTLGSVSGTCTMVEAAPSPALFDQVLAVEEEIKQAERRLKECELSMIHAQKPGLGLNPQIERTTSELTTMRAKLKSLREEKAGLTSKLQAHIDARIEAQVVQPGVTIAIGKHKVEITTRQENFTFSLPTE